MKKRIGPLALVAPALIVLASHAWAHPHVSVNARAEVLYAPDGKVTGIRHAWTFDKAYSAFITQGLDTNRDGKLTSDELQDLAKENTESLVDFEYFTSVKANGAKLSFDAPRDPSMSFANDEATLSYVLPLKGPIAPKLLAVEVSDPTFYVAFTLAAGDDAVRLAGAPKGCAITISRPKPVEAAQQQNLSESFFQALDAASTFGTQFANRAIVACP